MFKTNIGLFIVLVLLVVFGYSIFSGFSGGSSSETGSGKLNQIEQNIATINSKLQNNEMPHAVLLKQYADKITASNPDYADTVKLLAQVAMPHNPKVEDFSKRLETLKKSPSSIGSKEEIMAEENSLAFVTTPDNYDKSLIDPINTIAALSNGTLARLDGGSSTPGADLVGNPQYGQWKEQSDGSSIWEWLGPYLLFSHFMGGGMMGITRQQYDNSPQYGGQYKQNGGMQYESPNTQRANGADTRTRRTSSYGSPSNSGSSTTHTTPSSTPTRTSEPEPQRTSPTPTRRSSSFGGGGRRR